MTLTTTARIPPVRKVTVNDERSSEGFKAPTPFIWNCRLCYMHCNMTNGTNLPTPPPRLSTEKMYCLTTPSAGTPNLTPNRSVWCRKRMKASSHTTEWPKKMYTLFTHQYLWNKLWQCLDADGGHFEHLHWIQNSRTSLISILLLYKYSSYDYRVIFFMSKCVYIILGHSVFM